MIHREIYNIKDKNSQEILLYLQTKNIKNQKLNFDEKKYHNKNEGKISLEEKNENFPATRMKQFINKSFQLTKKTTNDLSTSLSKETRELTSITVTPRFKQIYSPIKIYINNNSKFSFSDKNENNNNSVNYLDFHLHENIYKKDHKNGLFHIYLPKKYKDDENYKLNLYKYLKAETHKSNIVRDRAVKTKKLEFKNNLSKIPKRKKLLSVKKRDINKIIFFDNNIERGFNLYKDENIGIEKDWQLPILYQNFDNDVDSDKEQIEKGKAKMMYDLRIGIIKWSQNKNDCYNYRRFNLNVEMGNEYKRCNASV